MVISKAIKMVKCFCNVRYDIGLHWVLMINSLNMKSKVVVYIFYTLDLVDNHCGEDHISINFTKVIISNNL